jgi:hypothetical protein
MLELFFNSSGIVHMEFISEGVTLNKHRYKQILRCLHNSICRKHPELWRRKNWLLLHYNAPAHHSVPVQEELAEQEVTVLPHPPYSSGLTPCSFFFFLRLKEKLCGHQFQSAKKIVPARKEIIQELPAHIFQQCFQQLYQCWQTCIATNGDCFERGCGYV